MLPSAFALASDSGKLVAGQRVDNSFTLVRVITCTGEKKPGRSPPFSPSANQINDIGAGGSALTCFTSGDWLSVGQLVR